MLWEISSIPRRVEIAKTSLYVNLLNEKGKKRICVYNNRDLLAEKGGASRLNSLLNQSSAKLGTPPYGVSQAPLIAESGKLLRGTLTQVSTIIRTS